MVVSSGPIDEALKNDRLEKDSKWSESIAVGRK